MYLTSKKWTPETTHYFYKTTNLINGKFYYGSGHLKRYIGSGKLFLKAVKKYGKENFKHERLIYFNSRESAYEFENRFLSLYDIKNIEKSYNLKNSAKHFDLGIATVKDELGNVFRVSTKDPRYLSGELVGITKGSVCSKERKVILSEKNKKYWADKVHHTKGMTTFKDKEGNIFHCKKDDPRVVSGELVSISKGMVMVVDKQGIKHRVSKDDIRIQSGELVSTTKGNIGWTAIIIIEGIEKKIKYWAEEYKTTINNFPKYCKDNNILYQWKNPKNKKFTV